MDYAKIWKRVDEVARRKDEMEEQAPAIAAELYRAIAAGDNAKVRLCNLALYSMAQEADALNKELQDIRKELGIH